MVSYETLFERIRSVAFFSNLTEDELRKIVTSGQIEKFKGGQVLYCQDEPCAGMFVLIHGRVNLCKIGPQGQQFTLSVIDPVIMFNEIAILDGGPNPATAIASQDCAVWRIQIGAFQSLVKSIPQVGLSLLSVLAKRNRRLIEHYEDLSFRSVHARVAKLLLDLSGKGEKIIDRREYTLVEMASRIATVPEAVSRSLQKFKTEGIITTTRSNINVTRPEMLAMVASCSQPFTG